MAGGDPGSEPHRRGRDGREEMAVSGLRPGPGRRLYSGRTSVFFPLDAKTIAPPRSLWVAPDECRAFARSRMALWRPPRSLRPTVSSGWSDRRAVHDDSPSCHVDLDHLLDWNRDHSPPKKPPPYNEEVWPITRVVPEIGHDADPAARIIGGETGTVGEPIASIVDHPLEGFRSAALPAARSAPAVEVAGQVPA